MDFLVLQQLGAEAKAFFALWTFKGFSTEQGTGPRPFPEANLALGKEKGLFAAMGELMLEEHRAIQEAFSTVGTNVGFGRGQYPQPLAETLLTLGHFKGLPLGVDSALCSPWVGIPSKREPWRAELRRFGRWVCSETVCVFVGVFSNMDPLMLHEDALIIEAFAADKTLVGFGPRRWSQQGRISQSQQGVALCPSGRGLAPLVDHPVLLQLVCLQEGLAAVGTHKEVLVHVSAHMRDEVGALAEALAALGTLVGLLTCVRAPVLDEV
jgi:hypothetical protein